MTTPPSPHVEVLTELKVEGEEPEEIVGMEICARKDSAGPHVLVCTASGRLFICDTDPITSEKPMKWRELPPLPRASRPR